MQADHPEWGAIALLTDFQLQIEHALDLQGRRRVLFVDACAENGAPPFAISEISANPAANLASHRLSPQAVMQVYQTVQTAPLPSCHLLAIRGTSFELGAGLSPEAKDNLEAALSWTCDWLAEAAKDCCQIHTGEMTVC